MSEIEPGVTVFLDRYRFESERVLSTATCDCGGRYAVVIREYTDLQREAPDNRVETSVRTSCHCAEERDPYRMETGPVHKLTGKGGEPWRVEKIYTPPDYRVRGTLSDE